jgi:drug/metabolite transporter (DMT)-like permease
MEKRTSIFLMLFCTVLTSIAQVFLKKGAMLLPLLFTNWQLAIGCFLYGLAAVIFIVALKGGELSVLYPIIATSYIWVSLLSGYYFNETITLLKWLGILSIVVGVSLIGRGSNQEVVQ